MGKKNKRRRESRRVNGPNSIDDDDESMVSEDIPRKQEGGVKNRRKRNKHQNRLEKSKKSRQAASQFVLRRGILNAVNEIEDEGEDGSKREEIVNENFHPKKINNKKLKTAVQNLQQKGENIAGSGWHKVTLVRAAKQPKDLVVTSLVNATNVPISPICLSVQNKCDYTFYVESASVAQAIKLCHQQPLFQDPTDGHQVQLTIKVVAAPPPVQHIDSKVAETIWLVMASRVKREVRALDMKSFHSDTIFQRESIYAPLSRSNVMEAVVKVIQDNVPDLEAVDFSDNRLPTLNNFKVLAGVATNIKILYLNNNRLADIKELEKIRSLRLVELNLAGNTTLMHRFSSIMELASAVQNIFPTLKLLDGQKLISFDEANEQEELSLPPAVKKCCSNPQVERVVLQFVEQYFKVYDSDNRRSLTAAYHEEAFFSMSSAHPPGLTSHGASRLTDYQMDSRNLIFLKNRVKRHKLLRQGRQDIIDYISDDLPKTKHDLASFCLDLPFGTEVVITFTISGVFRERTSMSSTNVKRCALRHFSRSFVIVPFGSGFVITNEMLFVTLPTPDQSRNAFADEMCATATIPEQVGLGRLESVAAELSKRTNMKVDWSRRCLEQTSWNLESAFAAFVVARDAGRIPNDAYVT